ncbi:AbrB/MazE/SpoVT family DNA-binding domain-containing protein [Candidatus Woesearchaeota archaeon]|nr:AbrB/MazE/SpoVT family DNA-binding domain-containing protein [Candidatus Woesearchaeota archaeon]
METLVKAKKWGSSLGLVIPKEMVKEMGAQEKSEFVMSLRPTGKSDVLKQAFGKLKGKGERKTAQEWKDEFRRTLYKEW